MQDDLAEQKAFDARRRRELAAFNRRERDRLDAICGKRSIMDVNLRTDGEAAEGEIVGATARKEEQNHEMHPRAINGRHDYITFSAICSRRESTKAISHFQSAAKGANIVS